LLNDLDLPVNALKSHCLRVGPRYLSKCASLVLCNAVVDWTKQTRFLGVHLFSGKTFQFCWQEFYRYTNAIFGRLGNLSCGDVILNLSHSTEFMAQQPLL